jgi:pilus assembly protein Flp/PilA
MLLLYVSVRNFFAEQLRREDRGATAVEYGLIVALIAAAIVVTAAALGTHIATILQKIRAQMNG